MKNGTCGFSLSSCSLSFSKDTLVLASFTSTRRWATMVANISVLGVVMVRRDGK